MLKIEILPIDPIIARMDLDQPSEALFVYCASEAAKLIAGLGSFKRKILFQTLSRFRTWADDVGERADAFVTLAPTIKVMLDEIRVWEMEQRIDGNLGRLLSRVVSSVHSAETLSTARWWMENFVTYSLAEQERSHWSEP